MEQLSTPSVTGAKILDALLIVVGEQGMDHATVREVAAAAGVAIGTVQHHFPTKDALVGAAFAEVVRRITDRVEVTLGGSGDVRRNLAAVLRELLPLDARRRTEARIQLAFAARAATSSPLADQQRAVLADVHRALAEAFAAVWGDGRSAAQCERAAHAALAVTDGLALHAVSGNRVLSENDLTSALDVVLAALLPQPEKAG